MRSATNPAPAGRRTVVDVAATVEEHLERRGWRVSANATQGYSLGGLILDVSGKLIAERTGGVPRPSAPLTPASRPSYAGTGCPTSRTP